MQPCRKRSRPLPGFLSMNKYKMVGLRRRAGPRRLVRRAGSLRAACPQEDLEVDGNKRRRTALVKLSLMSKSEAVSVREGE